MPTICSLKYIQRPAAHSDAVNNTKTDHENHNIAHIDISYADQEEAQWWSAILSPGQGWQATMRLAQATFLSPWSIDFQSNLRFQLSLPLHDQEFLPSNATFSTACEYLSRFCIYHNIVDQSHAALAAVLLLPSVNDGRLLQLPAPRISNLNPSRDLQEDEAQRSWTHPIHCPDRLLTLSCNVRGIRPMLLSVFYESQIECNIVTPWLQGTLSAIDTLTKKDPYTVGRMCMERTPGVAYLWLGATVLGLQERLLQDVRRGQIPVDLDSATWSGTVQSFMQQPVSSPLVLHGHVKRADECRLLFLSRCDRYTRFPVCQWKPFGTTSIKDVDIEVRVHSDCEDHKLQYRGLRWNTADGKGFLVPANLELASHLATQPSDDEGNIAVSYEALNRENEVISENATRSIIGWLRSDGWTQDEKELSKHPWLDMYDSESGDEAEDEIISDDDTKNLSFVASWVAGK